ncbi:LysR substrate-binding domain-containing protein [Streptomyces sp. NPDC091292]|uniref:LysR substrate-binding domain-containing protein n=1 Tax=Streptomyces sp. NPDC091292 TaxID=3365991 RepID=UPI0038084C0B
MELRHLQHFVAVAEDQHFTRAAERLMVSQSGLSASIRALERELRAPLFVRTTRQVTLTEAGRALLGEAERVLAGVRAAEAAVAAVQGVLRGRLALGTEQCIAGVPVGKLLAGFRARHPEVEIRLRQAGSGLLVEEVAAGRLDLAFAVAGGGAVGPVRMVPLTEEPMAVLCHPGHRLGGAGRAALEAPGAAGTSGASVAPVVVAPRDLADEAFVDFHEDWGPRRTTDAAFDAAGVRRTVTLEVNDVHSLLELVHEGLGIAVVPRHFTRKPEAGGLVARPLDDPAGARYRTVAVLPHEEATSPAARAMMALLPTSSALCV